MSKTYTLLQNGTRKEYGSKKTAVKYGDESHESYEVLSPSGAVVHSVQIEVKVETPAPAESKKTGDDVSELAHVDSRDFPGNYSGVMVGLAEELASVFGVAFQEERFPGKLVRRTHFGSPSKTVLAKFLAELDKTTAEVGPALNAWQKENAEKRRGLTDMQKFNQHREFITKFGKARAADVRKAKS